MRCCKFPKGYCSNNFNISDYVKIVEITSIQDYNRLGLNRLSEHKKFENDRKKRASKAVTSIRHRNAIQKSTLWTQRYFADDNLQIYVLFSWHTFLFFLLFYFHCCHLLCNYKFLLLIQQILWLLFCNAACFYVDNKTVCVQNNKFFVIYFYILFNEI